MGDTLSDRSGEFNGVHYARRCGLEGDVVVCVLPCLLYEKGDLKVGGGRGEEEREREEGRKGEREGGRKREREGGREGERKGGR